MKLDRNINPDGRGKYALINLRKADGIPWDHPTYDKVQEALKMLADVGVLTWGNESPGDQFFVMKYKDKFTADGLGAYAVAAARAGEVEYADELFREENRARQIGNRTPD
jgi:hypothetical protein